MARRRELHLDIRVDEKLKLDFRKNTREVEREVRRALNFRGGKGVEIKKTFDFRRYRNFMDSYSINIVKHMNRGIEEISMIYRTEMRRAYTRSGKSKISGKLYTSIQSKRIDKGHYRVGVLEHPRTGNGFEYAWAVNYGTGEFNVRGRGRKSTPWVYFDNATSSFKITRGQKASLFFERGSTVARRRVMNVVRKSIKRGMKKAI